MLSAHHFFFANIAPNSLSPSITCRPFDLAQVLEVLVNYLPREKPSRQSLRILKTEKFVRSELEKFDHFTTKNSPFLQATVATGEQGPVAFLFLIINPYFIFVQSLQPKVKRSIEDYS